MDKFEPNLSGKQLDTLYYVTHRLIPPMARIFILVGADVQAWYEEMPKSQKIEGQGNENQQQTHKQPLQKPRNKRGNETPKMDNQFAGNTCLTCDATTLESKRTPYPAPLPYIDNYLSLVL